jgi:hypothetical protein
LKRKAEFLLRHKLSKNGNMSHCGRCYNIVKCLELDKTEGSYSVEYSTTGLADLPVCDNFKLDKRFKV